MLQVVYVDDTVETALLPASVQVVPLTENAEGVTSEEGQVRYQHRYVDSFVFISFHIHLFYYFKSYITTKT